MGALECAGCTMIAFGPPLAIFAMVIARDPLRIILFVAGAFFWLLSLLISALLWYAVIPLRSTIEFGLFFSVAFQEAFRFIYYLLLKQAENGLEKVSAKGMHIEGVHSLKNAKHTIALVCGLGFGVMSGTFSLVNILADANGPGTVGFPASAGLIDDYSSANKSHLFFFTSSLSSAACIMLHVFWNVIFWQGCRIRSPIMLIGVISSHYLLSFLSLVNQKSLHAASLSITYAVTIVTAGIAFKVAGGKFAGFLDLVSHYSKPHKTTAKPNAVANPADNRLAMSSPTTAAVAPNAATGSATATFIGTAGELVAQ